MVLVHYVGGADGTDPWTPLVPPRPNIFKLVSYRSGVSGPVCVCVVVCSSCVVTPVNCAEENSISLNTQSGLDDPVVTGGQEINSSPTTHLKGNATILS